MGCGARGDGHSHCVALRGSIIGMEAGLNAAETGDGVRAGLNSGEGKVSVDGSPSTTACCWKY
jgi:hypothetical protein